MEPGKLQHNRCDLHLTTHITTYLNLNGIFEGALDPL